MIETPGDLVWDLPCMQQASCLEGGPLLWIWPLYLQVNQKSDDDEDDDDDKGFHGWLVGWLVVLGLTALWDSISVYIGPSPKEREKE